MIAPKYQYTFEEYLKLKEFEKRLKIENHDALILVDREAYEVVRFFDTRIMSIFYVKHKVELVKLLSNFLVGVIDFRLASCKEDLSCYRA